MLFPSEITQRENLPSVINSAGRFQIPARGVKLKVEVKGYTIFPHLGMRLTVRCRRWVPTADDESRLIDIPRGTTGIAREQG